MVAFPFPLSYTLFAGVAAPSTEERITLMNIDFSSNELMLLYGFIKTEYNAMKNQKAVIVSKSEMKLYADLILKMEKACPALSKLPL